jgi:hypothetical protein
MFAPYTVPPVTGISFSANGGAAQPLQAGDARLCLMAYAIAAQQALGIAGIIVDASTTPSLGMSFPGLDPASQYRPFVLIVPGSSATPDFLGYRVAQMYGPNSINGGGIGNPGAFANGSWVPTPIPAAPAPAPASSAGDPAAFYQAQNPSAPSASGGGAGLTTAQSAQLTHIENMSIAMLQANRIPVPTS